MSYQLVRLPRAMRQLRQLRSMHHPLHHAIIEALKALAEAPRPPGCIKLIGRPEWRLRVGGLRILYLIDDVHQIVTITDIGHRREMYRQ